MAWLSAAVGRSDARRPEPARKCRAGASPGGQAPWTSDNGMLLSHRILPLAALASVAALAHRERYGQ